MEQKDLIPGKAPDGKARVKRAALAAAPCFLLAFTLVFIGPLDILNANRAYVPFSAGQLLWPLLGLTAAVTLLLAALLALAKGKAYRLLLGGVFALALMAYLQGLFLNGSLASLDGSAFNWRDNAPAALLNLLLWLAVLAGFMALCLRFFDTARLVILVLCAAALVGQGLGLISTWNPEDEALDYQLDGSTQMELSAKENFIVITLDQMSPVVFENAIAEDEHMQESFKDFVFYNNMSAEYDLTFPSLCYLFTHQHYDNTEPTLDYFDRAWSSDSCNYFFDCLHERDYDVKLCVEANYAAYDAAHMLGKADNVVQSGKLIVSGQLIRDVLELSLYRYSPTITKGVYSVTTGQVAADAEFESITQLRLSDEFYDAVKEGVTTQDKKNCFAWYHLDGAHFPYTVGYDGLALGYEAEENSENRTAQLHGYLLAVEDMFDQMKALGLYDDATIIVSADHGWFECFQAAFLIKLPGQSFEEMQVNTAPVSQQEVMPTILSLLGADYSELGTTVFDWDETDTRTRSTCIWYYDENYPEARWIGDIDQWETVAHGINRYNVFYKLTYEGDREALMEKEKDMYYNHVADETLPLYDSFY